MSYIVVEGGTPLIGTVNVSGSKNLAIKMIYAAMFSNEDITLENVPHVGAVEEDLEIIRSVGAKADWIDRNTLLLNGSSIDSYKIPFAVGSRNRTVFLFTAALLYRFGKAFVPKVKNTTFTATPTNRFLNIWDSLGILYDEDANYYMLSSENISSANVSFKTPTQMGTENAILLSMFVNGETIISNVSQEPEVDDLILYLKDMGAKVERIEPTKIQVIGSSIFTGGRFFIGPDKTEATCLAIATLITNGNLSLRGVRREDLTALASLLMKIGSKFEFTGDELKIWRIGEELQACDVTISPFPGLVPDWQPFITLLLTKTEGESLIHDTVYLDRFDYVRDLNRMGARIDLVKPSEVGMRAVISDDSYDEDQLGEPQSVIKVTGPSKLKAARLDVLDFRYGPVLLLAALCAEGKSDIYNYEKIDFVFDKFFDKLISLGAKIKYVSDN